MNRLRKKCLIAVAGTHLLAVVVLFCSGFVRSSPKPENDTLLAIPSPTIDAKLNPVVRVEASPLRPPVVKPTEPANHVEPEPPKPQPRISPNLTPVVRQLATATASHNQEPDVNATAQTDGRQRAIHNVVSFIQKNTAPAVGLFTPSDSPQATVNYASIVKSIYTAAWNSPDDTASDDANVKVSVTIANNGRFTEAHIVEKSGDAKVDSSVQRTLDRVSQLEPFPDGAKDRERTYIINFNLKAKRQLLG